MKQLKKTATVLRIIGWVMLGVAAALTLYALATGSDGWSGIKNVLATGEKKTGAFERVTFDPKYFNAMRSAADTTEWEMDERVADVRSYFTKWEKKLGEGMAEVDTKKVNALYDDLTKTLDADEYLTFYDQMDSFEDQRHIKQAIEYIDSAVKPAGGKNVGGKKALTSASNEANLSKFYAGFSEEHGEEAGDYLAFVETIEAMLREDTENGTSVKDINKYLTAMDYERYQAKLAVVLEQERQSNEDIRDELAAMLRGEGDVRYTKGDDKALRRFADSTREKMIAKYGKEADFNDAVYHDTLWKLVRDENYDGSLTSLMKALRTAQDEYEKNNLDVRMDAFCKTVVENSDKSNYVGIAPYLWFLAANVIWIWVLGILLLVASHAINKVVESVMMKRLDHAGIEEEDGVLLRVEHLKQYFRSGSFVNKAVDDVSFYIKKGEVFGLVGESGCGKTTTGRTIINLYDPTDGDVYFRGQRISSTLNGLPTLKRSLKNDFEMADRTKRAETDALKQQNPNSAAKLEQEYREWKAKEKALLAKRISDAEDRALESHIEKNKCVSKYREKRRAEATAAYEKDIKQLSGEAAQARTAAYKQELKVIAKDNIMTKMQMIFQDPIASINPRMTVREIIAEGLKIRGVKDEKYIDEKVYEVLEMVGLVREHASRYPHEFSGGQRQRIGIARAIVLEPELIIADEPISALDVSIQAQVINLLNDLRNRMGLTIMFIAHNLSVVKYFSDRIGVMYYGHLVELTTSDELFAHPLHPYTKSLLSAIPYPDPYHEKYRRRITYDPGKVHDYSVDKPTLREIKPGHFIRCNNSEFEAYKKELGI